MDFVLTGQNGGGYITQIWRNLGGWNFTNIPSALPGLQNGVLALADFDNDGKLDIVVTGPATQLWRNAGNLVFTNFNAGLPGNFNGSAIAADFNNDGKPDILLGAAGTIQQSVYPATNHVPSAPTGLRAAQSKQAPV